MSDERNAVMAALEKILDEASDERIHELDDALRAHEAAFPRTYVRPFPPPLFAVALAMGMLRDLMDTMRDECGYRTACRECNGTGQIDTNECAVCEGEGRIR